MRMLKRCFGPAALILDLTLLLTGCVADMVVGVDGDWDSSQVEVTATFSQEISAGSQTGLRTARFSSRTSRPTRGFRVPTRM